MPYQMANNPNAVHNQEHKHVTAIHFLAENSKKPQTKPKIFNKIVVQRHFLSPI